MVFEWDQHDLHWIRKSKRSKPTLEAANADEYSAAESLILLANCGGGFCPAAVSTSKKHQDAPSSSAAEENDQAVAGAMTAVNMKKEEATSTDSPLLIKLYNSTNYCCHQLYNSTNYCCLVCGKGFQSYQALGGHMTSHSLTTASHKNPAASSIAPRGGTHECSFCHERFPTGQALGGHMRKHRRSPLLRKVDRIAGESPDGGATSHGARPRFDLNLPPLPEYGAVQEIIAGIGF